MKQLTDSFGRQFHTLRLSVTDVCNFRCLYCLPQGYQRTNGTPKPLTLTEIHHLVSAFAEMGFWKVRLTGGEPTIRRDIEEIAHTVSTIPGIRTVALSTNGYRLKKLAVPLKKAGVTALNLSVDSLNPDRFQRITGHACLGDLLKGIEEAQAAGFTTIKINVVLLKDMDQKELDHFLEWARTAALAIRFIELMRTGDNREFFLKQHVPASAIQKYLFEGGWMPRQRSEGEGPAIEFEHPDYQGRIGLIAPYAPHFCESCNRLRVSSQGGLRLCLFGEKDYSLRHLLQSEFQKEELIDSVFNLIHRKAVSHFLHEDRYGSTRHLAAIGG